MKRKLAVSIEDELIVRIDVLAEKLHASRSSVMERLLRDSLAAEESVVDFLSSPSGKSVVAKFSRDPKMVEALKASFGPDVDITERKNLVVVLKALASGKVKISNEGEGQ